MTIGIADINYRERWPKGWRFFFGKLQGCPFTLVTMVPILNLSKRHTTEMIMTTTELLNRLNELRSAANKPALSGWKESRAKLEAMIAKYEADAPKVAVAKRIVSDLIADGAKFVKPTKPTGASSLNAVSNILNGSNADAEADKPLGKPTKTAQKKAPTTKKMASSPLVEPISTIVLFALDHKLNARVVRARARKNAAALAPFLIGKHTYRMTPEVIAILKGRA